MVNPLTLWKAKRAFDLFEGDRRHATVTALALILRDAGVAPQEAAALASTHGDAILKAALPAAKLGELVKGLDAETLRALAEWLAR